MVVRMTCDVGQGMNIIIEKLKKEPFVVAITRSYGLAPYLRSDVYYDGMFADTVKVDGKSGCSYCKVC